MKKKAKYVRQKPLWQRLLPVLLCAVLGFGAFALTRTLSADPVRETEEITTGIDVARYQGTIDWAQVAGYGVDFAMIRIGRRGLEDGNISADPNALYNLQQAQKHGIRLGAYFFSTAVSEAEAVEEALWAAEFLAPYSITYPVAYDCEGFTNPESRQYGMGAAERTDIALAFLSTIEKAGYEGMFYGSKNDLETQWETRRIEGAHKIWVARYLPQADPALDRSGYQGQHHMWQYATDGEIPGIGQDVDLNVAYFGYDGIRTPQSKELPPEAFPDAEAMMDFIPVSETVTAKEETNLRSHPNQEAESQILYTLKNGELATRIAVSDSGWSKVEFDGNIYYAVSSFLTTDLSYTPPEEPSAPQVQDTAGFDTEFREVSDRVTAKELVNLRTIPSVTREDSVVAAQLKHGDVINRTGINDDVGWSRVVYQGQVLYCVTRYLEIVEE